MLRAQNLIKQIELQSSGKKTITKPIVTNPKTANESTKPPSAYTKIVKQPAIKKDIEIKLNSKTKQNVPVYMKAPFKTEPVKPVQRKSLSSYRSESKDSIKVDLIKSQTPRPESHDSVATKSINSNEQFKLRTSSSDNEFIKPKPEKSHSNKVKPI